VCAKFGYSLSNHGVCSYQRAKRGEHTDKHYDSVSLPFTERSASRTLRLFIVCAKFGYSLSNHGVCSYQCAKRGEHTDKHYDSVSLPFTER